ncbi:MAG: hypothetical protein MI824_09605 [Hyphomicrobiales bacterium]|nr:hypothetical protein [Hyphomicrobiales bacterium]
MKNTAMVFLLLGVAGGFTAPAVAASLSADKAVVFEQMQKCKADEKWDEKEKKCVKKEG